jgi:serine protease
MLIGALHGQLSLLGLESGQLLGSDMVRPLAMLRLLTALLVLVLAAPASAAYRRHEVIVDGSKVMRFKSGTVAEKVAEFGGRATPNYLARASFIPDDPGRHDIAGGWQDVQWNFLDTVAGINAPGAWDNLVAAGAPGGEGVVVAVVDTGVAYRNYQRFKRSPDFTRRLRRGYDFVDNDRIPLDHNGHGTHVASTIAEQVDNGLSLTGIAYGATIMPVRVLDRRGIGDSAAIASGIRYAVNHGAQIINLSFEFGDEVTRGNQIPGIVSAVRRARRRGVLVVGAAGNGSTAVVAYPARQSDVLAVGATTEHGCQADYSNRGATLDLSAPGGGIDADLPDDPNCFPEKAPGRDIYQLTLKGSVRRFGLTGGYEGTSMAAPHVSATAALVIASGVLGPSPGPAQIEKRLEDTALDLGKPGPDSRYGAGKVDAAAATAPIVAPEPSPTPTPSPTIIPK